MLNSNNGTFIALQMMSFGSKNFKLHARVKKCHFGNFLEWAGMAEPVSAAIKNSSWELKNLFVLGSLESLERLKGKIGEAPFY